MRSLSGTLTAAQESLNPTPYVQVVFNFGATTYTFKSTDSPNRIVSIDSWEEPYAGQAVIILKNVDGYFVNKDLRGYQVTVGWGYHTASGDEYSNQATLDCLDQTDASEQDELATKFICNSKWGRIEGTIVFPGGTVLTGTVNTISTPYSLGETITGSNSGATGKLAVVGATFIVVVRVTGTFVTGENAVGSTVRCDSLTAVTSGYAPLVYKHGDVAISSMISSLVADCLTVQVDTDDPDGTLASKPYLSVAAGTDARTIIKKLLGKTKCGARICNDGKMHLLYLNTASAYEYLYTQSAHIFTSNLRQRQLIMPNKVFFVDQLPDTSGQAATVVGIAQDDASVTAFGAIPDIQVDPDIPFASNPQTEANRLAAAWIAQMVAQAYQGTITAQVNCGQEVYDMVQVNDTWGNVTCKGRVGRIDRRYHTSLDYMHRTELTDPFGAMVPGGYPGKYAMMIYLGGLMVTPGAMRVNQDSFLSDLQGLAQETEKFPPTVPGSSQPWQIPVGLQAYISSITFSSPSYNQVSWTAGTVKWADGRTQSVTTVGSPKTISATTYFYVIYGNSTLQSSTTYSDAVGPDRVVIGTASPGSTTIQKAYILAPYSDSILINTDKIIDNLITELKLANLAVSTAKLQYLAVTSDIISAGAVTETKISDLAISTPKLQASCVTAAKIQAGTITSNEIAALTIAAGNIAANAVTTDKILAGAVTSVKINVATLEAITANCGTLTSGTINGVTAKFGGGSVVCDTSGITITAASDPSTLLTFKYSTYVSYIYQYNNILKIYTAELNISGPTKVDGDLTILGGHKLYTDQIDATGVIHTDSTVTATAFQADITGSGYIIVGRQASDPTGVNGMIYYRTSDDKFRIYQGGAWQYI